MTAPSSHDLAIEDHARVKVRGEWIAVTVERVPVVCSTCDDTHEMTLHRPNGDERKVMCTSCPVPCERCRAGGNGPYCTTPRCACDCHGGALLTRGCWSGRGDGGELVTWDASADVEPLHDRIDIPLADAVEVVKRRTDRVAQLEGALAGWRMRALLGEEQRKQDALSSMRC